MKKLILSLILSLGMSSPILAEKLECGVVINFPPGGTSDQYARLLQKTNPEWRVEYRVGSFAASAINFLGSNTSFVYFGSPVMFGANNPDRSPPIELYKILIGAPILMTTSKQLSLLDLATESLNIGVPSLGTAHHMIALQLQQANPKIQIIPTGGDNKALPLIVNGDLDLYLVSKPAGIRFLQGFDTIKTIVEFKFGVPTVINDLIIESQGFNALFIHKDATENQRKFIEQCVAISIKDPIWAESLIAQGVDPLDVSGDEKDGALKKYIDSLTKYGL